MRITEQQIRDAQAHEAIYADSRERDRKRVAACNADTLAQFVTGTMPVTAFDTESELADRAWRMNPLAVPLKKLKPPSGECD